MSLVVETRALLQRYDDLRHVAGLLAGCSIEDSLRHVHRCLAEWCGAQSIEWQRAGQHRHNGRGVTSRGLHVSFSEGAGVASELDWFSIGFLARALTSDRDRASPLERIAGDTRAIQALRDEVAAICTFEFPVIVVAERGSGKGLLARVAHECRGGDPATFFAVNCAAVPATLAESELFGHEKGAFTGAQGRRTGLFAAAFASNGTLYLDDVADLAPEIQPKILQAVEDRMFFPIGSDRPVILKGDPTRQLRIWSSAQPAAVTKLRLDLLDRLCTLVVTIPPLRERPLDVLLLADRELEILGTRHGRTVNLTREARAALIAYEWPGNVRQLKNVVDRAFVMSHETSAIDGGVITACLDVEYKLEAMASSSRATAAARSGPVSHAPSLRQIETEHILRALKIHNGNVSRAAAMLGLRRTTLQSRLRVLARRTC